MGSIFTIKVLKWADDLAGYVLWALTPYLTSVWKLELTQATAVKNLHEGVSGVLPLILAFLVDVFMGDYFMLLLSSLAYCFGMGFLAFATPSDLTDQEANKSIGQKQIVLFFTALALIAIGQAGNTISAAPFMSLQSSEGTDKMGEETEEKDFYGNGLVILIPGIAGLALYYIKSWTIRFIISASITFASTLLFWSGSIWYNKKRRLQGKPLKTCWHYVCMMPAWISIIICGVISSITSSYFVQQAHSLNPKLWIITVTLPALKLFQNKTKSKCTEIKYPRLKAFWANRGLEEYSAILNVGCAMVLAIGGCTAAAIVESVRLGVVKRHGLVDKPEEVVPMSMFWLIPQFFLLASFEGLAEPSNGDLLWRNLDQSINYRFPLLKSALGGAGNMASVVLVYVVGKVSEKGGSRPSWFQETLNKSRVDNYYWLLVSLASVNMVLLCLMSCFKLFRRRAPRTRQGEYRPFLS